MRHELGGGEIRFRALSPSRSHLRGDRGRIGQECNRARDRFDLAERMQNSVLAIDDHFRNPADGKDYAIWYNDCCGRGFCGRCFCNRNEGDRPVYHPYRSNDINWCAGASSQMYHCSTALVIGLAEEGQPEK